MSSKKLEDGTVVVTTPYSWAEPGHKLYPSLGFIGMMLGGYGSSLPCVEGRRLRYDAVLDDYIARLVLARSSNGHAGGVGISVREEDSALVEAFQNGSLNPAHVEEQDTVLEHD